MLIRSIKKLFLILWFLSVLWIMIGSLVNFHQYKIWNRPLIPEIIACKPYKEKSLKIIGGNHQSGDYNNNLVNFCFSCGIANQSYSLNNSGLYHFLKDTGNNPALSGPVFSYATLRAPPEA